MLLRHSDKGYTADELVQRVHRPAVLQVFGRMNKTIEGVPVEEGASYVNKYFLLPTDLKPTDTVTLSLDEGELEEGYYHMSAKVSMQTGQECGCKSCFKSAHHSAPCQPRSAAAAHHCCGSCG